MNIAGALPDTLGMVWVGMLDIKNVVFVGNVKLMMERRLIMSKDKELRHNRVEAREKIYLWMNCVVTRNNIDEILTFIIENYSTQSHPQGGSSKLCISADDLINYFHDKSSAGLMSIEYAVGVINAYSKDYAQGKALSKEESEIDQYNLNQDESQPTPEKPCEHLYFENMGKPNQRLRCDLSTPSSDNISPLQWFTTANPFLGNVSPYEMIKHGRIEKLCMWIQNQIEENGQIATENPSAELVETIHKIIMYHGGMNTSNPNGDGLVCAKAIYSKLGGAG